MKIFLTILIVFSFITNDVIAAGIADYNHNVSTCKGKGCFVVASRLPWEEMPQIYGLKVKSGPFVVTIPPNVISVGIGNTVTVFRYDKTPHIVIGTETKDTFQLTTKDISLSQALKIIFTSTPKDHKVSDKYNKELWNSLMLAKKGLLEQAGKAFIYKKGRLTAYYIPDAGEPYKNIAWVIDKNNQNSALRIESNMEVDKFKDILFSTRVKEK
jgi:hypothetical protein